MPTLEFLIDNYQKATYMAWQKRDKFIYEAPAGSGKTRASVYASKKLAGKGLVVTLPAVIPDWETEVKLQEADIDIVSWYKIDRVNIKTFAKNYTHIIVDESHKINSFKTPQSKTVYRLATIINKALLVTATPVVNNYEDLYWQLKICGLPINKTKYMDLVYDQKVVFINELKEKYKGYLTKPTRNRSQAIVYIPTPEKIDIVGKLLQKYSLIVSRDTAGLPQMKAHFINIDKDEDELNLTQVVNEIKKVDKALIFYYNTKYADELQKLIKGSDRVCGKTKHKDKNSIIAKFIDKEKGYLIGQQIAMGVGLSVRNCENVFFVQSTWSPAMNYQNASRCTRKGEKHTLKVHFFVSKDCNRTNIVLKKSEFGL